MEKVHKTPQRAEWLYNSIDETMKNTTDNVHSDVAVMSQDNNEYAQDGRSPTIIPSNHPLLVLLVSTVTKW